MHVPNLFEALTVDDFDRYGCALTVGQLLLNGQYETLAQDHGRAPEWVATWVDPYRWRKGYGGRLVAINVQTGEGCSIHISESGLMVMGRDKAGILKSFRYNYVDI
jgi:formylglycine-generating enzyme required for sulfatase activity